MNIQQKSAIASLALIVATAFGVPASAATKAATAKVGRACTKAGAKAGTKSKPLVCSRTKKVLRWTVAKKSVPKETIAPDTTIAADTTIADVTVAG